MEQIMNYVKPELIIVSVVLYFLGVAIKQSQSIKGKYIPLINGAAGIILCGIWVLSVCVWQTRQEIAAAVFTAITQGILVAGLSTYVDQIIKQLNKSE
ncbi:phage holin family protein [Lacrimispora sp.]|uniref:phage holin family protein n=1 Tax=Lacrimispora sp. TaxID=2719234 RepID=UPI0028A924AE|nr:phage holin family protein [Lacrimispora sp.]